MGICDPATLYASDSVPKTWFAGGGVEESSVTVTPNQQQQGRAEGSRAGRAPRPEVPEANRFPSHAEKQVRTSL